MLVGDPGGDLTVVMVRPVVRPVVPGAALPAVLPAARGGGHQVARPAGVGEVTDLKVATLVFSSEWLCDIRLAKQLDELTPPRVVRGVPTVAVAVAGAVVAVEVAVVAGEDPAVRPILATVRPVVLRVDQAVITRMVA